MEFRFDIEDLLPEEINVVDKSLILPGWRSTTRNRVEYHQLYELVNAIGEASSFAQGLNRVITTSDKLQGSDHTLYLMKEVDTDGRHVLVGMLKIGRKKLFLLTEDKTTKEVAPLCVLDFYIHESRQRRGYGRRLFDYMLRHQKVTPGHMAVDKPSEKFLLFLQRHYGLTEQVPQINNFAVFRDFFMERPVVAEEAALTHVSRSARSSRTASPEGGSSPHASRRGSNAPPNHTHYAGRPSRVKEVNMSDILHGRATERQTLTGRHAGPRYQATLEWMRGSSSGGDSPYCRTPSSYSPARTPSHAGSPQARTPMGGTPPRSQPVTPPSAPSHGASRKDSIERLNARNGLEASIAPTPATSPDRITGEDKKEEEEEVQEVRKVAGEVDEGDEDKDEFEDAAETIENMSVTDSNAVLPTGGKTGNWRDSVSRSSVGLATHMATKGSTMTGVLQDNDSVHGHLKFHHHALW